jgi:hypothetical protein
MFDGAAGSPTRQSRWLDLLVGCFLLVMRSRLEATVPCLELRAGIGGGLLDVLQFVHLLWVHR